MLCRGLIFAVRDRARPVPMIALAILLVFLTVWCHQLSRLRRKAQGFRAFRFRVESKHPKRLKAKTDLGF
jgi:hypothetical protein